MKRLSISLVLLLFSSVCQAMSMQEITKLAFITNRLMLTAVSGKEARDQPRDLAALKEKWIKIIAPASEECIQAAHLIIEAFAYMFESVHATGSASPQTVKEMIERFQASKNQPIASPQIMQAVESTLIWASVSLSDRLAAPSICEIRAIDAKAKKEVAPYVKVDKNTFIGGSFDIKLYPYDFN